MPKGEGQSGKKRGPYNQDKDDLLRKHRLPKALPPRVDVRTLIKPDPDPDLIMPRYEKKLPGNPKNIDDDSKLDEHSSEEDLVLNKKRKKIIDRFLHRKSTLL